MNAAPQYSNALNKAVQTQRQTVRRSVLGHQAALEELWDVWDECREANWDGYDAYPVRQETYQAAYLLIESLPLGFPRPSIGAEPDGQITLEWYKSQRRCLSVSVDPDGFLHYAGLYGPNKRYGTMTFNGDEPTELISLVRDI
jgi:hypothetical protein